VIEELEIHKERNVGKDVLDEERLAPAVVADDDVRPDTVVAEYATDVSYRRTRPHGVIEFPDKRVASAVVRSRRSIFELPHPLKVVIVLLRDEVDCISWLVGKITHDVTILGREILVDE
jgi:hypothetical protein